MGHSANILPQLTSNYTNKNVNCGEYKLIMEWMIEGEYV